MSAYSGTRYLERARTLGFTQSLLSGTMAAFLATTPELPDDHDTTSHSVLCAPLPFDGKVALIAAGTALMGSACVELFGLRGGAVCSVGRYRTRLDGAIKDLRCSSAMAIGAPRPSFLVPYEIPVQLPRSSCPAETPIFHVTGMITATVPFPYIVRAGRAPPLCCVSSRRRCSMFTHDGSSGHETTRTSVG